MPGSFPALADILLVELDHAVLTSDHLQDEAVGADGPATFARTASQPERAGARHATFPVTPLQFDPDIVAQLRAWRAAGGRTVLAARQPAEIVTQMTAHLALFDAVIELSQNADQTTDLLAMPELGARTVTHLHKNRPTSADPALPRPISTETRGMTAQNHADLRPYLDAMRPLHWAKNGLIFLPLLAAHQFDTTSFEQATLAFVSFCLVASAVYVVNDLIDLGADRAHPRKRNRPFAAGRIPLAHGVWMASVLGLGGLTLALAINLGFVALLVGYVGLTSAYSLILKRWIVVDIWVLAALYTGRVVAGGIATGIPVSMWLLAFSMFFFLSLAAIKRQAELVDLAARGVGQAKGRGYRVADLPIIALIACVAGYAAVLVLTLYVTSDSVTTLYPRPEAVWGACAVLTFWITRAILVTQRGQMTDDPVVYAANDWSSRLCLVAIFGFVVWGAVG